MSRSNAVRPGTKQSDPVYVDGYGNIVFEDISQAAKFYDDMLLVLYSNPRYFLDNIDHIKEFQVPWLNYSSKENCAVNKRHFAISHPYNE